MKWDVKITTPARKQLRKVPTKDKGRILDAFQDMSEDPYFGDIKWIDKKQDILRRRVGNWRIFFSIHQDIMYVEVLEIYRRTSKTYNR